MKTTSHHVEVQKDHISKVTYSTPIQAIAELIWNALDADSKEVKVFFNDTNVLDNTIVVRDNGYGIAYNEALESFSKLGGSWKKAKDVSPNGRYLHGQEGQGRFKAFSVGRVVEWESTYKNNDSINHRFNITCKSDNLTNFELTSHEKVNTVTTGCRVTISEFDKKFPSLNQENAIEKLTPIFATYLEQYKDVSIIIEGQKLKASELIIKRETISLESLNYKGTDHPYELEIIEWEMSTQNELYFCNSKGFPLLKFSEKLKTGRTPYTAYLKSSHITALSSDGTLSLEGLEPSLKKIIDITQNEIKSYIIRNKISLSMGKIEKWKKENVYPYLLEPQSPIETAERQIFDILALNIAESLPSFDESEINLKKFQFRLLKQIVEKSPEELQVILTEVLKLTKEEQKDFADLLKDVSLSAIITTSKLISERLKFIRGLEDILFSKESKKHLKERSQLHRIIAPNAWIFGDNFSLSVDDESLKRVLEEHQKSCKIEAVIDKPVRRVDGKVGIVDLMLSRAIPCNRDDQRQHLIVELKAPKVKIGRKEINQIKDYAFAVKDDERFRGLNTHWDFIIISNDLSKTGEMELKQQAYKKGIIYDTGREENPSITVHIKTWSELLQECKHRLQFMQKSLNINITSTEGIGYLKERYAEYTEGVDISE